MRFTTTHLKALLKSVAVTGFASIALFAIAPSAVEAATIRVQSGDTLSKLFPNNWQEVCFANNIGNCDLIYVNRLIETEYDVLPTRQVAPVEQSAPVQAPAPQPEPKRYEPASLNASAGVVGLSVALATPYVYGGTTPYGGFDCSGLTRWLSAQRGFNIPRTSQAQGGYGFAISRSQLQAGDLVIMNSGNHVGMYIGNNQVIHAINPSAGIRIENLDIALQYNPGYWFRAVR